VKTFRTIRASEKIFGQILFVSQAVFFSYTAMLISLILKTLAFHYLQVNSGFCILAG